MARYRINIPEKLPGLNDYIRACRTNRFQAANMKREVEEKLSGHLSAVPELSVPVRISFIWTEGNRRRDPDNVAFAKKFILDTLVKCGKLSNDDQAHVEAFSDAFQVMPGKWGVEIMIEENNDIEREEAT